MQLRYKVYIILIFCSISMWAKKEPKYPVSEIPKELKVDADAVVREKTTTVEVFSPSKMIYDEKYVITILKESGKDKALFQEGYSKFMSISGISATVYDAEGKKVKSIPQDEIKDYASVSGFSLYEDDRVKVIDPKYAVYPYTVEYYFQRKCNSAYYLQGWFALQDFNTAVEQLNYKIITPEDFPYHYKENNLAEKAKEEIVDGKMQRSWNLTNYKAIQNEVLSSFLEEYVPSVIVAPEKFEMDGFEGKYDSWENFGLYIKQLNEGKNDVPEETINKVRSLFKEGMSDYEKIAAVYKYSQDKNRYVSIQEGIGGYQPFSAETVDRLSYGDCKALSNYVVTLLNKLGYKAYYTLIYSGGQRFTNKDFVSNYFNHIVSCVHLPNDTVWLECTNSYYPCGYLGSSTDDRYALMIKEDGGELIKTPNYTVEDDNIFTTATVDISLTDLTKIQSKSVYKGVHFAEMLGLTVLDETDRRKRVIKSIDLPHFELESYKITPFKERKPWLEKELSITLPMFGSKMGDRVFIPLNTMNKMTSAPPYSRNRVSPVMISRPYSENDSVKYLIPEGYKMEALPDPVNILSEFGEYHSTATIDGQSIVYEREFILKKGHYTKEKYNDFVEFIESVVKNDDSKAVLIKI